MTKDEISNNTAISSIIDFNILLSWCSFDYHMSQNCGTQIHEIYSRIMELIRLGKENKIDAGWTRREVFVQQTFEEANASNKIIGMVHGILPLNKSDIYEVRRIASQINTLTNGITRNLYELRLVEDEIVFIMKNRMVVG